MNMKPMTRRECRTLALSALFCWDFRKDAGEEILLEIADDYFTDAASGIRFDRENAPLGYEYTEKLFKAAFQNVEEIDSLIAKCSQRWAVKRMPRVDLALLRMAVAEAHFVGEVPIEIIIDEALEIAKLYGSHASPRFVNGVLMGIFSLLGLASVFPQGKGSSK